MPTAQKFLSLLLIPLIILLLAGGIVKYLMLTKPEPRKSSPPQIIPQVEVIHRSPSTHTPEIDTFGTVRSFYETEISSLVAGEITKVSPRFQSGESVRKGEILIQINQADYLANIAQQKANIAKAKEILLSEEARGRVARSDWQSSGRKLENASPFTLREPQQEAARASLEYSKAALTKAELDLERTTVKAPYDAIISARKASPGSIVAIGTSLGQLIAREKSEVRLPLTPNQVKQLKLPLAFRIPEQNAKPEDETIAITLTTPVSPNVTWQAKITRTEATVGAKNQVIYVIAEIDAPFDPPGVPLPIGTFVKARMQGRELPNTLSLPESSIIDDSYVWVVDHETKLRRQMVKRLYSAQGTVFASLLANKLENPTTQTALSICTRPLPSFRNGQKVKTQALTNETEKDENENPLSPR